MSLATCRSSTREAALDINGDHAGRQRGGVVHLGGLLPIQSAIFPHSDATPSRSHTKNTGTMIRSIYNDQLGCIRIGERINIQEPCRSSKPAFPMVVLFLQMLS